MSHRYIIAFMSKFLYEVVSTMKFDVEICRILRREKCWSKSQFEIDLSKKKSQCEIA